MRTATTYLVLPILLSSALSAQTWSSSASLTPARTALSATTAGGDMFFAGGLDPSIPPSGQWYDTVNVFDPATSTWSMESLSLARSNLSATSVGSIALFAGGADATLAASDVVDLYHTSTGVWTTASLSQPRSSLAATSVGSFALFAGGEPGGFSPLPASDRVDVYDASTGTWSQTTLSVGRRDLTATTVGPYALFAGGGTFAPSYVHYDVVDVYDSRVGPPTDPSAWSVTTLSAARWRLAATTVGSRAFFAGGLGSVPGGSFDQFTNVDVYDSCIGPPTDPDAWSVTHLSQGRVDLAACSDGERAIFAGGSYIDLTIFQELFVDTVDVFDPEAEAWSYEQLSTPRSQVAAAVVGDRALFAGGRLSSSNTSSSTVDERVSDSGHLYVDLLAAPPGNGSIAQPFPTVQAAIDAAQPGDTIHIAPGTYIQGTSIDVDRDLTIVGTCGRDVTVLDGAMNESVLMVTNGATVELRGLALTNGYGTNFQGSTYGGGLLTCPFEPGTTVTLEDCHIHSNSADFGGGITSWGTLTLVRTRVEDNEAILFGGGLYAAGGTTVVRDCELIDNRVVGEYPYCETSMSCVPTYGGGIFGAWDAAVPLVENTLFVGNSVGPSGYVASWPDPTERGHAAYNCQLVNCTLVDNNRLPDGGSDVTWHCSITNSIVWDTSGVAPTIPWSSASYSLIPGGASGPGNIDTPPRFRDPLGPDGIPGTGDEDYRLRRRSPAIDAADNGAVGAATTTDLAGRPRFHDHAQTPDTGIGPAPVVDMGAYEFQPRLSRAIAQ